MVRRVITGQYEGRGRILSDGLAPVVDLGGGARVFEIWVAPRVDGGYVPGEDWSLTPPAGGSVFRIAEFPPAASDDEPFMHRTPTIDFGMIVEGELVLLMDEGETVLRAGDSFVQRQANHAWVNRSNQRCRMAVVLIDGEQ